MNPGTNKQVPDHSIMDHFNKQVYLGNQFAWCDGFLITGTSETPVALLTKPAVTAKAFPYSWTSAFLNRVTAIMQTASASAIIRVYFDPTVTDAGNAQDPVNLRIASSTVPESVLTESPTVSDTGVLFAISSGATSVLQVIDSLSVIDPAHSILITAQATGNSSVLIGLNWYEI